MGNLPGCFYPTEVVFVDDNENYLQMLSMFLSKNDEGILLKTFSDPEKALTYINTSATTQQQVIGEQTDCFTPNCYAMKFNIFSLHKQIYNPQRYHQVSVVIADHDLNSDCIDGIRFCQKIENKNIQKILFTGQQDQKFVIQAFNSGYIQHYVSKNEIRNLDELMKILKDSQRKFFRTCTNPLDVVITPNKGYPLAIYSDVFRSFFEKFLKENQIFEYYLLEGVGSFLLIDAEHHFKLLLVQNEDQFLANYLELQDEVSEEQRNLLKMGNILYYDSKFLCDTHHPHHCGFTPASTLIDGNKRFFYGVVSVDDWFPRDKINFCY